MEGLFSRTERIIGSENVDKLRNSSVLVLGIGGVGSYVVEGLARGGVGKLTLVDKDNIDVTNMNRQLPALCSTIGKSKVSVMAERVKDINPLCEVNAVECFFLPETAARFDFSRYDYVVDAIDNVTGKITIIEKAYKEGVRVISSMGTGNKLDPSLFKITTIEKTKVCPLARIVRKKLKEKGITGVKVIYSEEEPIITDSRIPGSISFVPSVAGLMIAGEVIKDIIK